LTSSQAVIDESIRLDKVAESLDRGNRFRKAFLSWNKASSFARKALGPFTPRHSDPSLQASLNKLAVLYPEENAYMRAEPLYVRALDIRAKALGARHPEAGLTKQIRLRRSIAPVWR
jgi:hypothetical protein